MLRQQHTLIYALSKLKTAFEAKTVLEPKTVAFATDVSFAAHPCLQKHGSIPTAIMLADHAAIGAHWYT